MLNTMPVFSRSLKAALAVWLLFAFFLPPRTEAAPETLLLKPDQARYQLGPYLEILEDRDKNWTIDKVSSPEMEQRWVRHSSDYLRLTNKKAAYWLRFRLARPTNWSGQPDWLLELFRPTLEMIELYFVPGSRTGDSRYAASLIAKAGLRNPPSLQESGYRSWVFKLPRDFPENSSFYLRLESRFSMSMPLILWTPNSFEKHALQDTILHGLLFGTLLTMVCYNFFIFVSLRDRTYIFYVLSMASLLLFQFTLKGLMRSVFGLPGDTILFLWWFLLANVFLWGFIFAKSFLSLQTYSPTLDRIMTAAMIAGVGTALGGMAGWVRTANIFQQILGLVTVVIMISAGLHCLRRGFRPARFFLLGWTSISIGTVAYVFQGLGLLPATVYASSALLMGAALDSILLAFALADRISVLREEKEALREREYRYLKLSLTDSLTGLFNQRYLMNILPAEIEKANRLEQPLSLIMIDLDDFKLYNDAHGHLEGDQVLVEAARSIREGVRDKDAGCRYGGEEFTVVLPGASEANAVQVAERIRQGFAARTFRPEKDRRLNMTMSLGLTQFHPGDNAHSLIKRADQALYEAKSRGKNVTVIAAKPE
ncbi:MAG: diguanylate cyclase [Thermodesulfobacteriota bacterium]